MSEDIALSKKLNGNQARRIYTVLEELTDCINEVNLAGTASGNPNLGLKFALILSDTIRTMVSVQTCE